MLNRQSLVSICVASALALVSASASAQELKAEKMTNVSYHVVEFIKFKEGSRDRAGEIVEQYFVPADKDTKQGVIDYHMMGGAWDFIVVFPLDGGLADLEWQTSPAQVAWMTALRKRAGGEAQAKALLTEWDGLVANRVWSIAHSHTSK